jgi:hypothetical protein
MVLQIFIVLAQDVLRGVNMTIFLLAGNYDEYEQFMKEKGLTRGVFYVSGLHRLVGRVITNKDKIVIYGTFIQRKDADVIYQTIESCKKK